MLVISGNGLDLWLFNINISQWVQNIAR
jgi:hypothetical protein